MVTKWQKVKQLIKALPQGEAAAAQHLSPRDVILFVTDRCNLKCRHCQFNTRTGLPAMEMSLDELEKILISIPPLRLVAMTGGEPFLRRDLREMVALLHKYSAQSVQINTNGSRPGRLVDWVDDMLNEGVPHLTLQLSIDGMEAAHDLARNTPGSFSDVEKALKGLVMMQKKRPRLSIGILTVINNENYAELEKLAKWIEQAYPTVTHGFDLIRGSSFSVRELDQEVANNYDPTDLKLPPQESWPRILRQVKESNARQGYPHDIFTRSLECQFAMLKSGRRQVRCTSAGYSAGVIYPDGQVAACEFSQPFDQLEKYDWNLFELWNGLPMVQRREQLKHCYCTHSCFLVTSIEENLKERCKVIWSLLKK